MDLLLTNIGTLATPLGTGPKRGAEQGRVHFIKNAAIAVQGNQIAYVGPQAGAPAAQQVIDCGGRLATPGLVDAHTHLSFGGWRQAEMAQRLAGASYLEILAAGGGILNTVGTTRAASEAQLVEWNAGHLRNMLRHGTTTCEGKSGYGLSPDSEAKQLRVLRRLAAGGPQEVVPTFLGAHALPPEYRENRQAYVDLVCDEMLPVVARQGLAEYCDVFCETGVFTPEESRHILHRAAQLGLACRAHVDEIDDLGGAAMAADAGCITAEHLIMTGDEGIKALAARGVIACLLPATSFYLNKPFARARDMIQAGVAVAIATDFNPGSTPNLNLQFPMALACLRYRLQPEEALTAVTLNGAAAVGRADVTGTLEVGKRADIAVWDAPDLPYIFYRYGSNLVHSVVCAGQLYTNP